MAFKLVFSEEAIADMAALASFISEMASSDAPAERFYNRVMESLENLSHFPESSPIFNREKDASVRYRFVDKRVVIFYRLTKTEIQVEAVRDTRSNWRKALE